MRSHAKPWEKAHALLQFLGYGGFAQWEAQTATAAGLRVTDAKRASRGALAVWLREGEQDGHEQEAEPYNETRFREALQALRAYTTSHPEVFSTQMRKRCAAAGVVVSFIKEYPKANATGAARWLRPDKGHIQLSLRHKTADMLWFSFYHEAEHLLGKRFKGARVDGMRGIDQNAEEEAACDAFARDMLIPRAPTGRRSPTGSASWSLKSARSRRSLASTPESSWGDSNMSDSSPSTASTTSRCRLEWKG